MSEASGKPGPWITLSRHTVYENPWIRVEDHRVINPSGAESQYGKVCFKNVAVAVIAVDEQGRIVLVGQHRYTLDCYSWELPMGGAPLAERPLEAAQRELREETGLTAAHWRELMRVHTSNSVTDELGIVFLAEELTSGAREPEATEDLAVTARPLPDVVADVLAGRITDAITVAGILRLAVERWTDAPARTTIAS